MASADEFLNVRVLSVYDGDTIKVELPGIPSVFGQNLGVRIKGIDTPEKRTKNQCEKTMALTAQKTVDDFLKASKKVDLKNCGRDKYFRLVCDVYGDGQAVSALMLEKGLAYQYDGGKKKSVDWCQGRLPAMKP